MRWYIRNGWGDFWSCECGWVDEIDADEFSETEKNGYNLPLDARWEENEPEPPEPDLNAVSVQERQELDYKQKESLR